MERLLTLEHNMINKTYDWTYDDGYVVGYDEGRVAGYNDGYADASADYESRLAKYWAELATLC